MARKTRPAPALHAPVEHIDPVAEAEQIARRAHAGARARADQMLAATREMAPEQRAATLAAAIKAAPEGPWKRSQIALIAAAIGADSLDDDNLGAACHELICGPTPKARPDRLGQMSRNEWIDAIAASLPAQPMHPGIVPDGEAARRLRMWALILDPRSPMRDKAIEVLFSQGGCCEGLDPATATLRQITALSVIRDYRLSRG